jgi:hypothetical protein
VREGDEPHFATIEQVRSFLNTYGALANGVSISGSTSDPLMVDRHELYDIIGAAHMRVRNVVLHFCLENFDWEEDLGLLKWVDRVAVSLTDRNDFASINHLAKKLGIGKVRVSMIAHSGNLHWFKDDGFWAMFRDDLKFTIRKNIWEPNLVVEFPDQTKSNPERLIFNQQIYRIYRYKEQHIDAVLWDYPDANKHINARYLWPDGRIERQCYWHQLYPEAKV